MSDSYLTIWIFIIWIACNSLVVSILSREVISLRNELRNQVTSKYTPGHIDLQTWETLTKSETPKK